MIGYYNTIQSQNVLFYRSKGQKPEIFFTRDTTLGENQEKGMGVIKGDYTKKSQDHVKILPSIPQWTNFDPRNANLQSKMVSGPVNVSIGLASTATFLRSKYYIKEEFCHDPEIFY